MRFELVLRNEAGQVVEKWTADVSSIELTDMGDLAQRVVKGADLFAGFAVMNIDKEGNPANDYTGLQQLTYMPGPDFTLKSIVGMSGELKFTDGDKMLVEPYMLVATPASDSN